QQLGGKLRWEAELPGRHDYRGVLAWMERQLAHTSATVVFGRRATAEQILALAPETVVLATGAKLRPLPNLAGGASARDWEGVGSDQRFATTAGLVDMDHSAATSADADALASRSQRLHHLTR